MTLLLVAALFLQGITPEVKQHAEAGLKARKDGNLEVAIREFRRVAELLPQLPAAHMNLGASLYEARKYPEAVDSLRKALQLDAKLQGAHGMLGVSLLAQGYAADAIPHLEQAGASDALGVALLEAGKPREAVDKLEKALAARPGDPDLLYYLAQALGQLSRRTAEALLTRPEDSARAHQLRGEAAASAGRTIQAEEEFLAALRLREDLPGVRLALGDLHLSTGDYDRAEREFRAEFERRPGDAAAAYKLGSALLKKGMAAEARRLLERADKLQPDMPEVWMEIGRAAAMEDDLEAATQAYERVLALEPDGALAEAATLQLAPIYRRQGKSAQAEEALRRYRELKESARQVGPPPESRKFE